ncbi:hypothetical protein TNCV_4272431 [Trichonephila clavipes]|nr:hypothetical protein TNCV_4272431 [Trichonephila clavipes]
MSHTTHLIDEFLGSVRIRRKDWSTYTVRYGCSRENNCNSQPPLRKPSPRHENSIAERREITGSGNEISIKSSCEACMSVREHHT